MIPANGIQAAFNYLVPASGNPHCLVVSQVFSATPYVANFNQQAIDAQPFIPSGVFVDNSAGTGTLTITIVELNYTIRVAAGQTLQMQFPAPESQTCNITGNGQATVVFVDFPVLPFAGGGSGGGTVVSIADGGDATLGSQADAPSATDTGNATVVAILKRLLQKEGIGPLPFGATLVQAASGNVANAAAVATLPAVATKTNYVSGLEITGGGATAAALVIATLAGINGGTLSYIIGAVAGAALQNLPLTVEFSPPIPASAVNTAVTLTVPALGAGNTNSACVLHGYYM